MLYKERLKDLREEKNLKQKELAAFLEITIKAYSVFETEYTIIPITHLNKLCNYFDVSLDYIFQFTNIKKYNNIVDNINIALSSSRLRDFRKENGLTQDKLANILNANRSTFSKYEKGINMISTSFLYQICKKYKISADYLLGKVDEPKYLN